MTNVAPSEQILFTGEWNPAPSYSHSATDRPGGKYVYSDAYEFLLATSVAMEYFANNCKLYL